MKRMDVGHKDLYEDASINIPQLNTIQSDALFVQMKVEDKSLQLQIDYGATSNAPLNFQNSVMHFHGRLTMLSLPIMWVQSYPVFDTQGRNTIYG